MPVPESKKAANARWDKKNRGSVACRLNKDQIDAFKAYAASKGKTVNAVLREYILECISHKEE